MKTERTHFENLRVFLLAEELADRIWGIALHWDWFPRKTIGSQIVRAADSIGANLAEGTGRGTYNDNRRFICIARGSLNETKYWLRRAHRRKLLSETETTELKAIVDSLAPMLNAYLNAITRLAQKGNLGSTNH